MTLNSAVIPLVGRAAGAASGAGVGAAGDVSARERLTGTATINAARTAESRRLEDVMEMKSRN
jgi:hypothetical protein